MKSILDLITTGRKPKDTEAGIPTKEIVCGSCKTEYFIPISANFMYFCPKCREFIGYECEYGFAPITPCRIYLGEKLIGQLTGGGGNPFRLECRSLHINKVLTKGYKNAAVYEEAKEIIKERLKKQ